MVSVRFSGMFNTVQEFGTAVYRIANFSSLFCSLNSSITCIHTAIEHIFSCRTANLPTLNSSKIEVSVRPKLSYGESTFRQYYDLWRNSQRLSRKSASQT